MGYILHHAMVVTSWKYELIADCLYKALELDLNPSIPSKSPVNSYFTILIPPDGSKEDWEDSNMGDTKREEFTKWLETHRYEDGSSSIEWVELCYSNDSKGAKILNHSFTPNKE